MGNALYGDRWWFTGPNNDESTSAIPDRVSPERGDEDKRATPRQLTGEEHRERLDEFKLELARKHEKRRRLLEEKRKEMEELREEVIRLKKENEELKRKPPVECQSVPDDAEFEIERIRQENEELRSILKEKSNLLLSSEEIIEKNRELRISVAGMQRDLQNLNKQVSEFDKERQDYKTHVVALKDVISVSKHMLQIRETQLKELKEKIEGIEQSLADREANILSQDLRNEYERQLQNIRNLRTLYEERQRVHRREKDELLSQLDDARKELGAEQNKVRELEERVTALEEDNSKKYDEIKTLESNFGLSKAESRQYQAELAVINQLFSEILLGFNSSQDVDLDKLQKHLEDHRNLLQDIVINEISPEVSYALPKVLLELLNQVYDEQEAPKQEEEVNDGKLETIKEESESQTSSVYQMNSAEEIVENLPKVWKVLIELLSHQKAPTNSLTDDEDDDNPCYKTVQTPKGPSLVLSVSQTFIRLKNLILEKKSLEKETSHLKQLNGHLENRLQDQEKRLEVVQSELSKTWLVVGKLQKQHQMLHTQEKILRYELAQKRKLLTELKEQLEYSREKWSQAREKNSNTEQQWKQLRTEFALRRNTVTNDNSVESGYSDERESSSSDEEPGYETDLSECAQKVEDISASGGIISNLNKSEVVEIVCRQDAEHSEEKTEAVQEKTANPQEEDEHATVPESNFEAPKNEKTEMCIALEEVVDNKENYRLKLDIPGSSRDGKSQQVFKEALAQTVIAKSNPEVSTNENTEVVVTSEEVVEDKEDCSLKEEATRFPREEVLVESNVLERVEASANENIATGAVFEEVVMDNENKQDSRFLKDIAGSSRQDEVPESTQEVSMDEIVEFDENKEDCRLSEAAAGPSTEDKTLEEVLAQREERLRRLENQAGNLVTMAASTANKSVVISNKLDSLHETYGQNSNDNSEVSSAQSDVDLRPTSDNQE